MPIKNYFVPLHTETTNIKVMGNNFLDNEIDKFWCSLFTDYNMKRVEGRKFVPNPAYIDDNFKQSENGKTKIAYELELDWLVDTDCVEWDGDTIRVFAKYFYELGKNNKDSQS